MNPAVCQLLLRGWKSANLLAGLDFTSGWTGINATAGGANSFTTTSTGGVWQSGLLTVGKRYRVAVDLTVSAGSVRLLNNAGTSNSTGLIFTDITSGSHLTNMTATDTALYFRVVGAATVTINSITIQSN